jgi:hypothetical protein
MRVDTGSETGSVVTAPEGTDIAVQDTGVAMQGCVISWPPGHGAGSTTTEDDTTGPCASPPRWSEPVITVDAVAAAIAWWDADGSIKTECINSTPSAVSTVNTVSGRVPLSRRPVAVITPP